MKIASYNIWNSKEGMPDRREHIIKEINKVECDIMCLQEVESKAFAEEIATKTRYSHIYFDAYAGKSEGLCILSRTPFWITISLFGKANAICAVLEVEGKEIGLVNLHLPWDSALERERQIIEVVKKMKSLKCDLLFVLGDFNCADHSNVQRFLLGECTLNGVETNPYFFDLAETYAELTDSVLEPTLNFRRNPRFINNTIEKNQRYDRILLQNTYPGELPRLERYQMWGKLIHKETQLAASDHYGVMVELK